MSGVPDILDETPPGMLEDGTLNIVEELDDFDPDQPRDPHGRWTKLEGSEGHEKLISSRNITAKGVGEEGKGELEKARRQYKRIDIKASEEDSELHAFNVGLFKDKRFYPGMQPAELRGKSTSEMADALRDRMADNLVYLARKVKEGYFGSKEDFENWRHWYEGAHSIADSEGKKAGIDVASASGVVAALSPQSEWFANVYQARTVMDTLTNKRDMKWDDKMTKVGNRIWSKGAMVDEYPEIKGKSLRELEGDTPEAQQRMAMWIRTENEAHSDRHFPMINPDGTSGEIAKTDKGKPKIAAWKNTTVITNAVAAYRSKGDLKTLFDAMGKKHKVRSFYNNILDPNSANHDVTIDTHAVGAAWLTPSTQNDVSVVHNLKSTMVKKDQPEGYVGASGSAVTGVQGTYPIYADAYRQAAKAMNVQPRELQSIVWEAKQRLFGDTQTGKRVKTAVGEVWKKFNRGKLTIDEAREQVFTTARKTLMDMFWQWMRA
jgi:hypothetical protein